MKSLWLSAILLSAMLMSQAACDSVLNAAYQGGEATIRSLVDLLLTDLANQVADSFDEQNQADDGGNDDANGDGDGSGDGGEDGDGDTNGDAPPADDPAMRGENLVADNCSACHGEDGASGFAPNIQGLPVDLIGDTVGGAGGHLMVNLTDEEISDIAEYLGSFDDGAPTGDDDGAARGEALHADRCAGCHGDDGASGFAANIQGLGADDIAVAAGGEGGHLNIALTPDEAEDIAAYLNSF